MGVFRDLAAIPPQQLFAGYAARAVHGERLTLAIVEVEATITFNTEGDKVTGVALSQGGANFVFKRVEQK